MLKHNLSKHFTLHTSHSALLFFYLYAMNRNILFLASILMAIAVACGALGAHFLKDKIDPDGLQQWETGVKYMIYHSLALLVINFFPSAMFSIQWVNRLFITGIILFTGSLFILSTREWLGTESLTAIAGPATPLGGLSFIAGWLLLGGQFIKKN
jgi:uncharacterized membrane protein YgdD (TMEM256/DUF423 family)